MLTKKLFKALDNFEWSFGCSAKYRLDGICLTPSPQFENCSDNSAGVFFWQMSVCASFYNTFFSLWLDSSSHLLLILFPSHLKQCVWFLTNRLHHLWGRSQDSLQYVHMPSAGEPSTGPSTTDVSHRAEQRGKATSLHLLAMLCLAQPRMLLAAFAARARCWLTFSLSTRIPSTSSAKPLSSRSAPACTGAGGYLPPGAELCISLCWTARGSCQPTSPAHGGPQNGGPTCWCSSHSSQCKAAEGALCPIIQLTKDDS